MRLNRFLARAGVASRRGADELVFQGEVKINGKIADHPGNEVDPAQDHVQVGGRTVSISDNSFVFRYYKPRGLISTLADEANREDLSAVAAKLPKGCVPAGRLDRDSEGLMIWSNNGKWIHLLTHPRFGAEKQYKVTVEGEISDQQIKKLANLGTLPRGQKLVYAPDIERLRFRSNKTDLRIRLREGKKRQIRQMLETLDVKVKRLVRVEEAGLSITGLKPGAVSEIRGKQLENFSDYLDRLADGLSGDAILQ